jgi:hypothetical protein
LAAASTATPFQIAPGASSPVPAAEFPLELRALPAPSAGKSNPGVPGAAPAAPKAEPAAPASTPLLDAAIQRVAEVTRQHREAIDSSPPTPTPVANPADDRMRPLGPVTIRAKESADLATRKPEHRRPADLDEVPLPERISDSPHDELRPAESPSAAAEHAARPSEPVAVAPELTTLLARPRKVASIPDEGASSRSGFSLTPTRPAEGSPAADAGAMSAADYTLTPKRTPDVSPGPNGPGERAGITALASGELRLCRRVFGFGSFEPLASERVKAGQHLLLYCELTGIQYEERGADFVSRISSRVEIKPEDGGPVLWTRELGDAQDVCRRRRRDYYVNYRVDLPKTLVAGRYRLRLLQTDLVAGSSTSSEIPFEITP